MGLKIVEENLDAVDAAFHSLYSEKDGKFHLTGIDGLKTDADITRLQSALAKERNDHKAVKEKYSILGDKDPVEVIALLDKIPELEAAAKGNLDDTKIDGIVQSRIKAILAPVERELQTEKQTRLALETENKGYKQKEKTNAIHTEIRKAAVKANVRQDAIDDIILIGERFFELSDEGSVIAKEVNGITAGIDPNMWLSDQQEKKPYWWGETVGGGAQGSGAFKGVNNPWSAQHWNMTEQGKLYMANPTKAAQMAKAAGSSVGGKKPQAK